MTFKEQVLQIIREHEKKYHPVDDYITTNELAWLYEEIRSLDDNPWYTGKPTEDGEYVVCYDNHETPMNDPQSYVTGVAEFNSKTGNFISWQDDEGPLDVKAFGQKIEPYKENEDGKISDRD